MSKGQEKCKIEKPLCVKSDSYISWIMAQKNIVLEVTIWETFKYRQL